MLRVDVMQPKSHESSTVELPPLVLELLKFKAPSRNQGVESHPSWFEQGRQQRYGEKLAQDLGFDTTEHRTQRIISGVRILTNQRTSAVGYEALNYVLFQKERRRLGERDPDSSAIGVYGHIFSMFEETFEEQYGDIDQDETNLSVESIMCLGSYLANDANKLN